jgi:hypothetical protein
VFSFKEDCVRNNNAIPQKHRAFTRSLSEYTQETGSESRDEEDLIKELLGCFGWIPVVRTPPDPSDSHTNSAEGSGK